MLFYLSLFFGPPIVVSIILCIFLNIPFRFIAFPSPAFRNYWGARLILAIGGFVGLSIFKFSGGYEDIFSSVYSPIGTDERGLAIYWLTIGVITFGVLSLVELSYVIGKRLRQRSLKSRSEQGAPLDG